jgi:GT2 family glycosyltransferase
MTTDTSSLASSTLSAQALPLRQRTQPVSSPVAPSGTTQCEVSFVIVSWNAKDYLRECLASLSAASRGMDTEVIVVDNASSDGSWMMVRDEFPTVKLLRKETNAGFARANNRGIESAHGRYLCLVNSDVHVFPEAIKTILEYMEAHPDVGLVGPKALNGDRTRQPTCRTLPTLRSSFFRALSLDTAFPRSLLFGSHFMTNWDYDQTREVDILGGCFWMIRRSALQGVGLLDTQFFMYGEDMDFCRRCHAVGWKVIFHPAAQIIHYGGASSSNAPARFWIEMQRANLQYWIKHRGRASVLAYYACLLLHHGVRVAGLAARRCLGSNHRDAVRANFDKNWRGLKWLLAPGTLSAVVRGRVLKQEAHNAK